MQLNIIYKETCLETLSKMPDAFIDCVITSPPYWQLRDYGYPEQWGLEPTFQEYLEHLWSMMDEIYRVLKPTGSVWVNLGDTYNSSTKGNRNGFDNTTWDKAKTERVRSEKIGTAWKVDRNNLPEKMLLLLPHRFAIGCIDRGWIVRNDIVWAKRNAMPESVTDRFSKKHEYFFLMTKSENYFFDLEAVRDKCPPLNRWGGNKLKANGTSRWDEGTGQNAYRDREMQPNDGMKNPGDVADFWNIPTKPSDKNHYASYNDELLKKPMLAGCPEGGLVYDPFMGSGTTAAMAIRTKRNWIGSEMSDEYFNEANKALIPLLTQTSLF